MKPLAICVAILLAASAFADEPKPLIFLSDMQKARVREIQYQGQKVFGQILQLQLEIAKLNKQGTDLELQLKDVIGDIAKQNNIDREKFSFNQDLLTWEPKPTKGKP